MESEQVEVVTAARDGDQTAFAELTDRRCVATAANGHPAIATDIRPPGGTTYQAFGLDVLRVVDGLVAEITCFGKEIHPKSGQPPTLDG